jgi:hypothetical protein
VELVPCGRLLLPQPLGPEGFQTLPLPNAAAAAIRAARAQLTALFAAATAATPSAPAPPPSLLSGLLIPTVSQAGPQATLTFSPLPSAAASGGAALDPATGLGGAQAALGNRVSAGGGARDVSMEGLTRVGAFSMPVDDAPPPPQRPHTAPSALNETLLAALAVLRAAPVAGGDVGSAFRAFAAPPGATPPPARRRAPALPLFLAGGSASAPAPAAHTPGPGLSLADLEAAAAAAAAGMSVPPSPPPASAGSLLLSPLALLSGLLGPVVDLLAPPQLLLPNPVDLLGALVPSSGGASFQLGGSSNSSSSGSRGAPPVEAAGGPPDAGGGCVSVVGSLVGAGGDGTPLCLDRCVEARRPGMPAQLVCKPGRA